MRMLLIIDATPDKLDQIVMFVPEVYDRERVIEETRDLGIASPRILTDALVDVSVLTAIRDHIDTYAAYCR